MELRFTKQTRLLFLAMLGSTFVSLSYFIFVYNPLQVLTAKIISIYPGSIASNLFKDPPYEIFVKIYIFNVTNSEEFLNGDEKLRFNEVGPYVYREVLYNINSTYHKNGSLSFTPRRLVQFVPEHSIGNPEVDTLLSPNIPLLGITAALHDYSFAQNIAVSTASSVVGSESFKNLTIHDYLYGYDDPLVTLANNIVPNWIDFSRFGILDRMMALDNGSDIVTMNVNAGETQNSVERWNGLSGLPQWGYITPEENETNLKNSICNTVEGAFVGTIFPPNIQKNTTFRLYRHAFCRPVPIRYEGTKLNKDGFEGYMFRAASDFLARPEKNPENDCYCNKNECLLDGLGDMSTCYYDIPITMSQPHFYNADPSLLEQVDGLYPNKEKHDCTMLIHPEIGLPLEVSLRLQINLKMPNVRYNSKVTPFNNLVLPLFWIDLYVEELPGQIKLYITLLYHILPVVQQVLIYGLATAGVALIFGSAVAALLYIFDGRHKKHLRLRVNYKEIPVFPLKTKLLKPQIRISK